MQAIVTSHWSIILTLYLWLRCHPGRFSMAAYCHDRRGIYRCVLLCFRGRIEIDHSYSLRWSGLCCHSWHSTHGAGRRGRAKAGPTRAVPGVAAQTTPAQTVLLSIPITNNTALVNLNLDHFWQDLMKCETVLFVLFWLICGTNHCEDNGNLWQ